MSQARAKALVTGAAGMIGSHLSERLAADGDEVLATFAHPSINMETVNAQVQFTNLDVCDRNAVFELVADEQPTELYHLAAQSLPTVSWNDPWQTMRVNAEGTINIFEAVKAARASTIDYDPMIVVACSSAEYGASLIPERVPISEDAPLLPLHPYGVSKVAQDLLAFQYFRNFGLRCVRARIFNCTGPRKRNDVASDFAAGMIVALHEGKPLRHGNLDTRRAIIDVRDMVTALVALARRGVAGEAYNISADCVYKMSDLLEFYFDIAGVRVPTELDPALLRASDEPVIYGDIAKIRRDTGWAPTYELRQTLSDMLAFQEEQYQLRAQ